MNSASSGQSRRRATGRTGTKPRQGGDTRHKPAKRAKTSKRSGRVAIRMYRQGLGDCFLVSLPQGKGGRPFYIMIDCGVILGTLDAAKIMTDVVNNIVETTGGDFAKGTKGKIDLLVATHRHWDHLSGFVQASDAFKQLQIHQTWLGWTENPQDDLAQKLGRERDQALAALQKSVDQLRLAGASEAADEISGILSFFGAAKGGRRQRTRWHRYGIWLEATYIIAIPRKMRRFGSAIRVRPSTFLGLPATRRCSEDSSIGESPRDLRCGRGRPRHQCGCRAGGRLAPIQLNALNTLFGGDRTAVLQGSLLSARDH